MPNALTALFRRAPIGWWDLADILVVSILIYEVLKLIRGTRAVQMAVGAGFVAAAFYVVRNTALGVIAVAIPLAHHVALAMVKHSRSKADSSVDARELSPDTPEAILATNSLSWSAIFSRWVATRG